MSKKKSSTMRCELTTDPRKLRAADRLAASVKDALPAGLSQPALRAFAAAGITSLADFTRFSKAELAALHGVGPKGLETVYAELRRRKLKLRS
ncbi:MAG: helix-hairpin-helix domain-containing protein [Pirellulales bacterium]